MKKNSLEALGCLGSFLMIGGMITTIIAFLCSRNQSKESGIIWGLIIFVTMSAGIIMSDLRYEPSDKTKKNKSP